MAIIECLWGICALEKTTLIIIIVGSAVGGFFLGLILGLLAKGSGSKKETIKEIHYRDKPET